MPLEASLSPNPHWPTSRLPLGALLLLAAAAAIYPIWAVKYPPFLDYPNHVASSYVLAHLHDTSLPFHNWYGADWGLYPYMTLDAVLQVMQSAVPIEPAGRIYMSLAAIGLPLAIWFFLREANPGQDAMALWALVGAHNIFFLLAFMNYYVSLSFCFLGLGLWLKWVEQPRAPRWLFAMLAITTVYFSHLVCFGFTGLVVTAYCVFSRRSARQLLLTWAMFVPGGLCYFYSARVVEKQAPVIVFLEFSEKLDNLRGIVHGYSTRLDFTTLAGMGIYFLAAWYRNPEFKLNWRWIGVGAVLFAAYWATPWAYGDGSDLDVRVLPILFGIILAFTRVGRRGWWLAPVALILFFARVGNITENFRAAQPELEGLAGAFPVTPMNARVLPIVQADPESDVLHHSFAHFWAYGVIRRHWYSPYLMTFAGVMPLQIREDAYTLDGFWDLDYKEKPDWNAVEADYDYVWCYNKPEYDEGLAAIGSVVYESGKLRMYKINGRGGAAP